MMHIRSVVFPAAIFILAVPMTAQMRDNTQPTLNCSDNNHNGRLVRHCEMREQTVAYAGQLNIDGGQNGGVQVKGWSRPDVLVRAKVDASAASDSDARGLAGQVRVNVAAGQVSANGPDNSQDQNWSVSYEVFAPHQANIQIRAHNGGVHISDINGRVDFSTVNGGVRLARLNGHVQGKTTNGGVHVEFTGSRWEGDGMDVETTNGGVHMSMPANYSAHLEASTVNGGVHSSIPMTVSGKIGRQLAANLGSGGATIRVVTTNGGVHIDQI
jgi:DUF4097 and DUF4098 domain-containing protein YvlB